MMRNSTLSYDGKLVGFFCVFYFLFFLKNIVSLVDLFIPFLEEVHKEFFFQDQNKKERERCLS